MPNFQITFLIKLKENELWRIEDEIRFLHIKKKKYIDNNIHNEIGMQIKLFKACWLWLWIFIHTAFATPMGMFHLKNKLSKPIQMLPPMDHCIWQHIFPKIVHLYHPSDCTRWSMLQTERAQIMWRMLIYVLHNTLTC